MDFQFPDPDQRTLPRILTHRAETQGDREFLQFGSSASTTFAQMESRTNRLARGLRAVGVNSGDRVAMVLPNCAELVHIWFAAAKLGAVEVPINFGLRGGLLAHVVANSGAEVLVCHANYLGQVAEVVSQQPTVSTIVVVCGDVESARDAGITVNRVLTYEELQDGLDRSVDTEVRYCDPLAILYTSGTTGPAKGVVMPHNQYYMWVEMYAENMGLTRDDTYFSPLPLFHGDAQLWGVYFPLVFGTKGTLEERFSASRYWDQVRASGATATNVLGAMAHILWKKEPSELDPVNPLRICQALPMIPFKAEFEQRFGLQLVTAYGQTETNWVAFDTPNDTKVGSCGRVNSSYFDVRIVDDGDEPCPPGTIGEITVRPKHPWIMSQGYHKMPEQTLEACRNLWFHTGDSGCLDEDGWLYFADRIKDAIRRRGQNISAFELESVIDDHPDVLESAAIAVPSELSEDDAMVVIVPKQHVDLTLDAVLDYCRDRLPKFMVPRYIEIRRDRLPRTPTEKIAKEQLRQQGVGPETWDTEQDAYVGPRD